jgi:predicted AAA+ superfamily ATPase
MIDSIISTYKRLLLHTEYITYRYLYDTFSIKTRLTGLIGPRGTGKTTLLLQYIKNKISDVDQCIYVSMDNIYFANNRLVDFVNELHEVHGIKYFFLDEIHKYPNWDQELKNIYDSYPDIYIVFSGSSSIDLIHGSYDLSRRGVIYRIKGLSFREYLWFCGVVKEKPISFKEICGNRNEIEQTIGAIPKIRGHFKEYLQHGYYPFFNEDIESYNQKLFRIVEKTIYEDIANYYKLKTENLVYFKKILAYIGTIPPGELNRNSIAKNIGLDNKTIQTYLSIMEDTGLVTLISNEKSQSTILKSTEKIYLENPNLYQSIMNETGFNISIGSVREIFFINMIRNSGKKVFYSNIGDFVSEGYFFEIGGRNKKTAQIKEVIEKAYLVKDDIVFGSKYEIPLYLFGFLY